MLSPAWSIKYVSHTTTYTAAAGIVPGPCTPDAVSLTTRTRRLLIDELPPTGSTLNIRIKDGVDGSGCHAIYHQSNNANTHNMIMYMFCLRD